MSSARPFLTAQWRELLLLNFEVPPAALYPYVPHGTEIDLYQGRTYLSVVGFRFVGTRLWGMAIPGHGGFAEVNLRFYVRRQVAGGWRRGVVFVCEIVARPAVTAVARWLYGENYVTRPMRCENRLDGQVTAWGDRLSYRWCVPHGGQRWQGLSGRVAGKPALAEPGSLSEFIIEHYWGYVRRPGRPTGEYRVDHPRWSVADADQVTWDCDSVANFPQELVEHLDAEPVSAIVADGSAVSVFPRTLVAGDSALRPALRTGSGA